MKVLTIAIALLLAVAAAPVASAQPEPKTIDRIIAQEKAKGLIERPSSDVATGAPPTVVVEHTGGFDWGDAAIGAAAGLAVALVLIGGLALARGERRSRYGTA
jgi:hypothetical protein